VATGRFFEVSLGDVAAALPKERRPAVFEVGVAVGDWPAARAVFPGEVGALDICIGDPGSII
jgi:hypothetical protein